MPDIIETPITEHKIPGGYWKLVAYVLPDASGVHFKIEHTRQKGNAIPCSVEAASVLLEMKGDKDA